MSFILRHVGNWHHLTSMNSSRQGPSCSSWTTFVLSTGSICSWGKQKLPHLTTTSLLPIYPRAKQMGVYLVTIHRDFSSTEKYCLKKAAVPQQRLVWDVITQHNPRQQWQKEDSRDSLKGGLKDLLPLLRWSAITLLWERCFYLKYWDQFFCLVNDSTLKHSHQLSKG